MASASSALPTLYIWPRQWGLPSFDPSCLAAVLYLQLTLPGRFAVVECTSPDTSPSGRSVHVVLQFSMPLTCIALAAPAGQMPYLAHGHHFVAPLSSILKYVAALNPASLPHEEDAGELFSVDLDVLLSPVERAKKTAWCAHVESNLGDLVVCPEC